MKCRICKEEIHLYPSATARAKKYGETPAYYTGLFTTHSHCIIKENAANVSLLMARYRADPDYGMII
jgi:hypothetical protein